MIDSKYNFTMKILHSFATGYFKKQIKGVRLVLNFTSVVTSEI